MNTVIQELTDKLWMEYGKFVDVPAGLREINDALTRDQLRKALQSCINQHITGRILATGQAICDVQNNPPCVIDQGGLVATYMIKDVRGEIFSRSMDIESYWEWKDDYLQRLHALTQTEA